MSTSFTHLDRTGRPGMVDVTAKESTSRSARASARIFLPPEVLAALEGDELMAPKGAVVQTAILAGTMAAKKTWDLIPLCHPLPLGKILFAHRFEGDELVMECETSCTGQTGVEMEALTGVSIAALTVYDMCKALSHRIEILQIRLLEKRGGKSGHQVLP